MKIHLDKTKICLTNQRSNKRMEVSVDNFKVEVLLAKECAKYLGQTQHSNNRRLRKSRVESEHLGRHLQVQTRFDIEMVHPTTQTSLIQLRHYTHADVRLWHLNNLTRTKN